MNIIKLSKTTKGNIKHLKTVLGRIENTIDFIKEEDTFIYRKYGGERREITKFIGSELNNLLLAKDLLEEFLNYQGERI